MKLHLLYVCKMCLFVNKKNIACTGGHSSLHQSLGIKKACRPTPQLFKPPYRYCSMFVSPKKYYLPLFRHLCSPITSHGFTHVTEGGHIGWPTPRVGESSIQTFVLTWEVSKSNHVISPELYVRIHKVS